MGTVQIAGQQRLAFGRASNLLFLFFRVGPLIEDVLRLKEKWFFNNLDAFYMGRFDVTGDKIAAIHPVAQNSVYGVALELATVVGLDS